MHDKATTERLKQLGREDKGVQDWYKKNKFDLTSSEKWWRYMKLFKWKMLTKGTTLYNLADGLSAQALGFLIEHFPTGVIFSRDKGVVARIRFRFLCELASKLAELQRGSQEMD